MNSWAIPAVFVVAVEYAFAFAIGMRVGFHYRIPFETYMTLGLAFAGLGVSAIIVFRLAVYALQHERAPARRLLSEIPYLSSFVVAVLLAALQISVLTWTKVMLPIASPFWADPLLARADHLLFGIDPWIVANRLFGWATPLVDRTYVTWAPAKYVTFLFVICMPESRTKARALLAYFLMMAMVAIGQYALSSAGPVFYARLGFGPRFEGMSVAPWVATARDYLWHDYLKAGGAIGGGISAMPSLHVAAALWLALVWTAYQRHIGIIAAGYFCLIAIGSVLLGWHYAADAIVAVLITAVAWVFAGRLVIPSGVRVATRMTPSAAILRGDA